MSKVEEARRSMVTVARKVYLGRHHELLPDFRDAIDTLIAAVREEQAEEWEALREALKKSWWYDCYMCNVCSAKVYNDDSPDEHEPDCIVRSILPVDALRIQEGER